MKLRELVDTKSARDWNRITGDDLKKAYQQMKASIRSRAKTFAKHGMPVKRSNLPSMRGMDEETMRDILKDTAAYMRGKVSSYRGYMAYQKTRLSAMQNAMPEMGFKTVEDVAKFGKFMNDMEDRFGNIKYDSNNAKKLYQQAQRLNVDPKKFMKNYEYWAEHVEDLEKMKPIKQRAGSRALKPSDYARKIKNQKKERKGSE